MEWAFKVLIVTSSLCLSWNNDYLVACALRLSKLARILIQLDCLHPGGTFSPYASEKIGLLFHEFRSPL